MTNDNEYASDEQLRSDRELFSSLLKHIVQTAPNEDPTDFVLSSIGRNVGADRCYVYRFWDPSKTSMCTNTHTSGAPRASSRKSTDSRHATSRTLWSSTPT